MYGTKTTTQKRDTQASARSAGLREAANCAKRIVAVIESPVSTAPPYSVKKPGNVPRTTRANGAAANATTPRATIPTIAAQRLCGDAGSVARSSAGTFTRFDGFRC